jgi:hypothetical protein
MGDQRDGLSREQLADRYGELAVQHSERFRKVSTRYPHVVTQAYDGDIEQAQQDDDETVAARVADFERSRGYLSDWHAIGRAERGGDDELD